MTDTEKIKELEAVIERALPWLEASNPVAIEARKVLAALPAPQAAPEKP